MPVRTPALRRVFSAVAIACCSASIPAFANPIGPTIVNGTATIASTPGTLQITNSPNAIINWQSFSIGASEITRFVQQNAASAVLNRVTGANPSTILGALQSNGRVFLINPNGILFGFGSQVDVAGLVASTLNLSDADFLAGRLRFTPTSGAAAVANYGNVTTPQAGQVYLVGPAVTNGGIITSPKGEVVLAAGNSVELVNPGTPNLSVEITAPDNQAVNMGQVLAEAGRIGIYAGLVNNQGQLRADNIQMGENGEIHLRATKDVNLGSGSLLRAAGRGAGISAKIDIEAGEDARINGGIVVSGPLTVSAGGDIEFDTENPLNATVVSANSTAVTAGGNIALNSDSPFRGALLDSPLEMSLTTTTPGKTITQEPDSVITARAILDIKASGDVSLTGANNISALRALVDSGGDLTVNNASPELALALVDLAGGGTLAINQTGSLLIAGNVSSGAQAYNVTGDFTVGSWFQGITVAASGPLSINAGGTLLLQGGPQQNTYVNVTSVGPVDITTGGDVRLMGGSARGAHALLSSGAEIDMTVGGTLRLNAGSGPQTWARIQTSTNDTPISVVFPNRASGGYFVNDVEGEIRRGRTGLFTGTRAAVPGETLLLDYGSEP